MGSSTFSRIQRAWLLFAIFQISQVSAQSYANVEKVRVSGSDRVIFKGSNNEERIVRDIVFLRNGVHVDMSYNETSLNGEFVSSPGCPKTFEGRPWLYYGNSQKCYIVGFQGPCPYGQRFFSNEQSKYGVCSCDCFTFPVDYSSGLRVRNVGRVDIGQNLVLQRRTSRSRQSVFTRGTTGNKKYQVIPFQQLKPSTPTDRYHFCFSPSYQRQVVYDRLRQECYPFLDQGPCKKEQWLVRDMEKQNGIECEKRKCPKYSGEQNDHGGGFTYFDYRKQECAVEVYGSLQETFFASTDGLMASRAAFCTDAGMRYSSLLKSCVHDKTKDFNFDVIG